MQVNINKIVPLALLTCMLWSPSAGTQAANAETYYRRVTTASGGVTFVPVTRHRPSPQHRYRSFHAQHPVVSDGLVGAGVGAAAGGLGGLILNRHRIGRSILIGAGTGAGVGMIHGSQWHNDHPILGNTATGGLVGLGLGGIVGHRKAALTGLGIGSGVGLGAGLLSQPDSVGYY